MSKEQIEEMARYIYGNAFFRDTRYLSDCMSIAADLYTAGYHKQAWISVEERLPDKDGMYLIFSPYTNKEGGIVYCNRFLTKGNPIFPPNSFESISKVTHWMPLPVPPKGGEGK